MAKVRVTERSQVYKLQDSLERAKIGHGTEAVVPNFEHFLVTGGEARFCYVPGFSAHSHKGQSDGRPLPDRVTLPEEIQSLEDGWYNIQNLTIRTNGTIELVVTEETKILQQA